MNDKDIATAVMDHFDPSVYSIRYVHSLCIYHLIFDDISAFTIHRRRKVWGLSSTREQHHSVKTIATHVDAIKECFPNRGAETIRKALLMEKNIRVPRSGSHIYMRELSNILIILEGPLLLITLR